MFIKLLKFLWVIREESNRNRNPKLGRGHVTAIKFNPFNPLSYLVLLLIFIVGIIMFGVVGFWKEIDLNNPFKWH